MRVGIFTLTYRYQCRICGGWVDGGTQKRAMLWMWWHLRRAHKEKGPGLLSTLWDLWRWSP